MIDELLNLLEVHAHLRDFPTAYKNLRAHIEERLAKLDDQLGQKAAKEAEVKAKADAKAEIKAAPEVERRA